MRHHITTRSHFVVFLFLAIGAAGGYWTRSLAGEAVLPTQQASVLAHPLTIAAQRARTYPGGTLNIDRRIGVQPGIVSSVFSYPSDGFRITGLMAVPADPPPLLGYPVIILAHGYVPLANYRTDGPEYTDYIRAFVRAGYMVVKPDFRGYGGSEGEPQSAYYSPSDTADLLNLAASLSTYPHADASRIGLFGHSMGGHVVLNTVSVAPTRFRAAAIISAGVGEVGDMYANWRPRSDIDNPGARAERTALVAALGDPAHNPTFWKQVSPLTYAHQITTPILLSHGSSDRVIPVRFTMQLADALADAGHPATVDIRRGAGHTYAGADQQELIAASLALFDANLKLANH